MADKDSTQDTLSKAGLHAIRLAREGDLQAAELIRAQMARINELEAQADALLDDAERYQWLKADGCDGRERELREELYQWASDLDAEIDAAKNLPQEQIITGRARAQKMVCAEFAAIETAHAIKESTQ